MAELLKEAIADAKAVREVALQNAKMALEEAFDSKLKSMLSARLAEEIEEDVELEETYMEDEKDEDMKEMSYMKDEKDEDMKEGSYDEDEKDEDMKEEFSLEEDLDEEINLDELMAELEEMSYEEDEKSEGMTYDEDDDMKKEGEEPLNESISVLLGLFGTLLGGQFMAAGGKSQVQKRIKDAGGSIGKGLKDFFAKDFAGAVDLPKEGIEETFDIDALVAEIESEIEEGKKKKKDDGKEEEVKEAYGDSPGKGTGPAKGKPGAPFGDGKSGKGSTGYDGAVKQLKEERDEALATVSTLKETISEMNLLNSKLLYCNKLFRANALNEAQKVKVVDALDKATTTSEAKLVFETLQESFNFTGVEKRAIKEGLARASKPVGTAPKKVLSESVDETVSRFQKLANINK